MRSTPRSRSLAAGAVVLAALAVFLNLPRAERVASSEMGLVVPAYFYPRANSGWEDLTEAAARVPITAILNPASGPGSRADDNFAIAVGELRAAGGRVIGYVPTGYGLRPLGEVTADVDRYREWYEIDGIFLDEMSNSGAAAVLNYYGELYSYIKDIDAAWEVIGNPGTHTHESHILRPTADRFVVTENDGADYASYTPSPWNFDYDSSHFAHLVHSEPSADAMIDYVALARSRNAGFVYITDDVLNNPWNTLPSYWDAEVAAIAAINGQLLAGDYNGNGAVEQADLDLVLLHWGQPASTSPPNWTGPPPEGTIDQNELDAVLLGWGEDIKLQPGGATAISEPASLVLVFMAVGVSAHASRRSVCPRLPGRSRRERLECGGR